MKQLYIFFSFLSVAALACSLQEKTINPLRKEITQMIVGFFEKFLK